MSLNVLVLGAGFGGLELSSHLAQTLGDRVAVTLIDRSDAFVFGYAKLDLMFGKRTLDSIRLPYRDLAVPGVTFRQETITAIDPVARRVTTDGGTYTADILVVALGAGYDIAATPGLGEHGHEFYSVEGAARVRDVLAGFGGGHVVVGICGPSFKCPPAPSECAIHVDELLRAKGVRDASSVTLVSPFGVPVPPSPELSAAILARFAERGITYRPDRRVTAVGADGSVTLDDGSQLPCDLLLGIPVHRVPDVVAASGLAENGWIPVAKADGATRFPGVYAVGDVTSVGTPKAGVFAERLAHVLAETIVAQVRGTEAPAGYDGTGACWIEIGSGNVARVDVDFFSTPGKPIGVFTPPSAETAAAKDDFGPSRHRRWFGLAGS